MDVHALLLLSLLAISSPHGALAVARDDSAPAPTRDGEPTGPTEDRPGTIVPLPHEPREGAPTELEIPPPPGPPQFPPPTLVPGAGAR